MTKEAEQKFDIEQIEKEAEQIIEKAKKESERILAEAKNNADFMLSNVKVDILSIRDAIIKDAQKRIKIETLIPSEKELEELEKRVNQRSAKVIQQVVRAVMGLQ